MPGRNGAPALFGRFTLLRPLARSASGSTWLAIDEGAPGQPHVALRLFNGRAGALINRDGAFADRLERLRGRAMTGLPTLLAFGSKDNHFYAVFSWQGGESLEHVMASGMPDLSPIQRSRLVRQLARGLNTLHRNDILHLSLSPSTILYDRERNAVRLVDWGHMHPKSEAGAAGPAFPDVTLDNAPYTSPGAIAGEPVDVRDDIFAYGCVAFELLTGAHPYDGQSGTEAAAQGLVPPNAPALSGRQNRAISAALTLEPARRNITLEAAARAFTHRSQAQPIVEAWARMRRIDLNRRSAVAIIAFLAFCVVYGGLAIWDASQSPVAVASTPAFSRSPIDVVMPPEPDHAKPGADVLAVAPQTRTMLPAPASHATAVKPPVARLAQHEAVREQPISASEPPRPAPIAEASEPVAPASTPVALAPTPPIAAEPEIRRTRYAAPQRTPITTISDQPVSYRPSDVGCFNCDCPTLSNKRSFSTDPLRREEQEYLRRNCG